MARRALWILGFGPIGVLGAAVALAVIALDRAPGWVGDRLQGATGRESSVGSVNIDWSWTPTITLTDVAIANAEWGEAEHLLSVREARFRLRLLPLLRLRIEIPEAEIAGGSVAVERRAGGESNWSFSSSPGPSTAAGTAAPEERDEVPVIGRLRITDSVLTVRDEERGLDLDGAIATAIGEGGEFDRLELSLEGSLQGKPLTIALTGGSVLMLRDSQEPYPLDLAIEFGETRLTVAGRIDDPIAFEGAEIEMTLSGPDLAEVFPLLGIPAPPSPPYEAAGQLKRDGEVWEFAGIKGRVGDSELAGDLVVDYGRKTPLLRAKLVAERLHFQDLAPLFRIDPEADDTVADKGQLLPDVPLDNLERLHAMDMDVELAAERVEAPVYLALSTLNVTVRVEGGRAEVNPLRLGVAGGVVKGSVALNARSEVPSAAADLTFEKLDLAAFFKQTEYFDTMGGEIQGRLDLLGSGRSLAELIGNADGSAAAVMTGGAISGLLVEGAGLDLGEALILVVGDDAKVPVRCAMVRIEVEAGRAQIERAVLDTSDSVLYVSGNVNLLKQTLGIDIEAQAKDFSLLDLDAPVRIEGALGDPDISIGKGAPIPLLELGEGEDVPCDDLIAEYMRPPKSRDR